MGAAKMKVESRHTVVDGEIQALSVSQLSKFNDEEYGGCPRKWWFDKVKGEKEPTTKQQELGTSVHAQKEHYLRTGEDVLGKIASAGKHLLPAPGKDLFIEWGMNDKARVGDQKFYPREESKFFAGGIPMIGFIDLINPRGVFVDNTGNLVQDPPGTVEAHDHKTTSKLKYAKTGPELLGTSQMVGYGAFLALKFPTIKFTRLTHLYETTDGKPVAQKSSILVPVAQVLDRWGRTCERVIPAMRQVAKAEKLEDVPKCRNAGEKDSACHSFGRYGCSYKTRCFPNPLKRLSMGLLKNRNGAAAVSPNGAVSAVPAAAPSIPPPSQAPAPRKLSITDNSTPSGLITANLAEQGKVYVLGEGIFGMFLCSTGGKQSFLPFVNGAPGGSPILLDPATPISLSVTAPVQQAAPVQIPLPVAPISIPAPPTSAKKLDEQKLLEEPVKEKKSRAKKETTAAATAPAAQVSGIRLCINCIPTGDYKMLDGYIAEVTKALQDHFQVDDIRFALDKDSAIAFNRWRGALAAAVRAEPPEDGVYVALTRGSELAEAVTEALIPLCVAGGLTRAL